MAASCGNPSARLVDGRHGSTEMDCRAVPATFGNEMLDECAVALRDPPLLTLSRSMTPRCLFDLWGSWQIRESNSRCSPAEPSGKVPDTHSVDSICDHDFGVFTVTNIATENTDAVLPAHPLPRTPKAANQGLQRCRGPSVPLTCLAPLAAWQSLCTGHVDGLRFAKRPRLPRLTQDPTAMIHSQRARSGAQSRLQRTVGRLQGHGCGGFLIRPSSVA
jgi:hypothetical protein